MSIISYSRMCISIKNARKHPNTHSSSLLETTHSWPFLFPDANALDEKQMASMQVRPLVQINTPQADLYIDMVS